MFRKTALALSSMLMAAGPHGSKDMPVWGPLFQSLEKCHDGAVQQRVANIVGYIETLLAK